VTCGLVTCTMSLTLAAMNDTGCLSDQCLVVCNTSSVHRENVSVLRRVRSRQPGPGRAVSATGAVDRVENSGMFQHYPTQAQSLSRSVVRCKESVQSRVAPTCL